MTPSAPVVIEMLAADADTPFARVLVGACSEGLRDGGPCALEGATAGASARAVAIVSWDGEDRASAKIDVGVRRGGRADWHTRRVSFAASDAQAERWRSVGLIIATLVGAETPPEPPAPVPPPTPPVPPPEKRPIAGTKESAGLPARRQPWFFEVGASGARGTADVVGAWGPAARAGLAFRSSPLFLTASLRYETEPQASAQASTQVHLDWGWVTAGLGLAAPLGRAPDPPLLVEVRLEPTVGVVRASAVGAADQWGALLGVREGLGITWWWARWLGPSLSAEALQTTRSTVVNVSNGTGATEVAKAQWFGWSAGLGLRVRVE